MKRVVLKAPAKAKNKSAQSARKSTSKRPSVSRVKSQPRKVLKHEDRAEPTIEEIESGEATQGRTHGDTLKEMAAQHAINPTTFEPAAPAAPTQTQPPETMEAGNLEGALARVNLAIHAIEKRSPAAVEVASTLGGFLKLVLSPIFDPYNPELLQKVKPQDADVKRLEEVDDPTGLIAQLPTLSQQDVILGLVIKKLEAKRDQVKTEIEARLLMAGSNKVLVGTLRPSRSQMEPKKTLSKELLLVNGVTMDIIEACEVKGKDPKPSIQVYSAVASKDLEEMAAAQGLEL